MIADVRCCLLDAFALFCFFNHTATTEIYTLSLHDALPISPQQRRRAHRGGGDRRSVRGSRRACAAGPAGSAACRTHAPARDRKSTRLNSSHVEISYAVFCLKKKIWIMLNERPVSDYFLMSI